MSELNWYTIDNEHHVLNTDLGGKLKEKMRCEVKSDTAGYAAVRMHLPGGSQIFFRARDLVHGRTVVENWVRGWEAAGADLSADLSADDGAPAKAKAQAALTSVIAATDSLYELTALAVAKLVQTKNAAYGNSFAKCGEFLKLLYPDGCKPEQFQDMLTLVRVFDKLMRIATDKDALGENPWSDVLGYSLLALVNATEANITPPTTKGAKFESSADGVNVD